MARARRHGGSSGCAGVLCWEWGIAQRTGPWCCSRRVRVRVRVPGRFTARVLPLRGGTSPEAAVTSHVNDLGRLPGITSARQTRPQTTAALV
ncbi:hypothetical protein P154DRAFT_225957 [Amniculicola lignicola CBS 123094]|uniref:Uncharacterized protein n=1 Tax=Amniculicola lignicola CBS 123094 TaxID=1392246 RepID=A0A6A5WC57_9PLEO|nr:hypothetical protein P154DRAFT_225957 [Amniculicola lignicola CBS 123094]